MANASTSSLCFVLLFSLYFLHTNSTSQVHIVYLGHSRNADPLLTSDYHVRLLANVFQSDKEAKQAIVYSYRHRISGFAATLNQSQATVLENTEGVISVFKSKAMQLHTTRSWDFMGLTLHSRHGNPLQLAHGSDVIVGIIDTGVWPESASFMEEPDMGPIPKSWNGTCVPGEGFDPVKACNKKLIGARYYLRGYERKFGILNTTNKEEFRSARDLVGHGTHTASTAVGSRSTNASLLGFAGGTARGGAPRARLAVYKACWSTGSFLQTVCMEEDILAAFDDALNDGVHVISVSLGQGLPLFAFFKTSFDIGSFHAMQLGVSVVSSAGNNGPDPSQVGNVNPWSICVGASSMDRSFPAKILLEDGSYFVGEGLISKPIIGVLTLDVDHFVDGICNTKNWLRIPASGKILVCFKRNGQFENIDAEYAAYTANASALIFVRPSTMPVAVLSLIPVVQIDTIQGSKLYLKSYDFNINVQILPSDTTFTRSPAPMVLVTSSRGPSSISPDFLKPDISAPGKNILAAWPPNTIPSLNYRRSVKWNILSGTSVACPHVSGVVALIKSAHPNWSPAAIRSALMTTAHNVDVNGDDILVQGSTQSSDPFDIGAGHMNPVAAFDPGLIYDMSTSDYVQFLCNDGYSDSHVRALVNCQPPACPKCSDRKPIPNWNINYPSITVSNLSCMTTVTRTVRYVGLMKPSVYFVSIENPNGVWVDVWPRVLAFSYLNEEKSYRVILRPQKWSQGRYDFGAISWSNGYHVVRSPLIVQVNNALAEKS